MQYHALTPLLSFSLLTVALPLATGLPWMPLRAMRAVPSVQPSSGQQVGYVSVSVATVWTDPSKPRPVDAPALTNPVGIQQWLDSMSVDQYRNLTDADRTQTQALYGAPLAILSSDPEKGWYQVAVAGQPTPKNTLGYPGWVPAAQVSLDSSYGDLLQEKGRAFAQVDKVATTPLYRDAQMNMKAMNLSYATRLPVLSRFGDVGGGAIQVAVPSGGSGYIAASDATLFESTAQIPYPSGQDLVRSAKLFLHRPYLWGGTSGFAFDCSGFTHTLYEAHGITIPRDADAQADFTGHGRNVARSDLRAGDLIYYASKLDDPGTIYHVAMYAGQDQMVEAYAAGIPVRVTPVRFGGDYWGAQRFLTH